MRQLPSLLPPHGAPGGEEQGSQSLETTSDRSSAKNAGFPGPPVFGACPKKHGTAAIRKARPLTRPILPGPGACTLARPIWVMSHIQGRRAIEAQASLLRCHPRRAPRYVALRRPSRPGYDPPGRAAGAEKCGANYSAQDAPHCAQAAGARTRASRTRCSDRTRRLL